MLAESGRPSRSSATDCPMLLGEPGRIVQRTPGPGSAEGELAGLLVAFELVRFLVDTVFEPRANGMRSGRFGEGGCHGMVVDRAVFVGMPVADIAGEVDAR